VGMSIGSASRSKRPQVSPQMNVTPLVDIVLVLLIIFMVITPLLSKQMWLQLPKQDDKAEVAPSDNKSVVLTVDAKGALAINGAEVPKQELRDRLERIMAARSDKVLYFDAADGAPYASTVEAMDIAKQGGVKTLAVLTTKVAQ
jgi:biopolymer transport protein TolR